MNDIDDDTWDSDWNEDDDCFFCNDEHSQSCDVCGVHICDNCAAETPIGTWCPDCAKDNVRFIPDMPEAAQ